MISVDVPNVFHCVEDEDHSHCVCVVAWRIFGSAVAVGSPAVAVDGVFVAAFSLRHAGLHVGLLDRVFRMPLALLKYLFGATNKLAHYFRFGRFDCFAIAGQFGWLAVAGNAHKVTHTAINMRIIKANRKPNRNINCPLVSIQFLPAACSFGLHSFC